MLSIEFNEYWIYQLNINLYQKIYHYIDWKPN